MQRMIELKLTKCILYLTEQELIKLLAKDTELWQEAIQRGKAFKRHEQAKRRNTNTRTDTKDKNLIKPAIAEVERSETKA